MLSAQVLLGWMLFVTGISVMGAAITARTTLEPWRGALLIGGSLTVSGVALILSKGDVGVIHAIVVGCGGVGLVIGSIVKLWEFSRHHEHR